MSFQIVRLQDLLTQPDVIYFRKYVYLPMEEEWSLSTRCCLLDTSDIDGTPEFAIKNGLEFAIEASVILETFENLKEQIQNPTAEQLLEAFLFYYDNDAFLRLEDT